jgi:hypothetical protein
MIRPRTKNTKIMRAINLKGSAIPNPLEDIVRDCCEDVWVCRPGAAAA